jgi:hypothetical protein
MKCGAFLSQIAKTESPDSDASVLCRPAESGASPAPTAIETSLDNQNTALEDRNAALVAQKKKRGKGSQNPQQDPEQSAHILVAILVLAYH